MTAAPQEAGGGAATRPLSASSPADLMAPALRRRMACWLYEGMLLFGLVFTAGLVFSIAGQMRTATTRPAWAWGGAPISSTSVPAFSRRRRSGW